MSRKLCSACKPVRPNKEATENARDEEINPDDVKKAISITLQVMLRTSEPDIPL